MDYDLLDSNGVGERDRSFDVRKERTGSKGPNPDQPFNTKDVL